MHLNLEPAHLRPRGRGLSRLLLKDWLHLGKLNGDITDHENERHTVAGSLINERHAVRMVRSLDSTVNVTQLVNYRHRGRPASTSQSGVLEPELKPDVSKARRGLTCCCRLEDCSSQRVW